MSARADDGYEELDTWDEFGGDSLLMRDEIDRLRLELERTNGDLAVAVREATRCREALQEALTLLADAIPDPKGAMDSPQWHRRMDALAAALAGASA